MESILRASNDTSECLFRRRYFSPTHSRSSAVHEHSKIVCSNCAFGFLVNIVRETGRQTDTQTAFKLKHCDESDIEGKCVATSSISTSGAMFPAALQTVAPTTCTVYRHIQMCRALFAYLGGNDEHRKEWTERHPTQSRIPITDRLLLEIGRTMCGCRSVACGKLVAFCSANRAFISDILFDYVSNRPAVAGRVTLDIHALLLQGQPTDRPTDWLLDCLVSNSKLVGRCPPVVEAASANTALICSVCRCSPQEANAIPRSVPGMIQPFRARPLDSRQRRKRTARPGTVRLCRPG